MQVSSPSSLTRYRDRQKSSELSQLPDDLDLDLFHENDNHASKDQTLKLGDIIDDSFGNIIDDSLVLAGLPEVHDESGKSGVKRKAKSRSHKAKYRKSKRRKTTLTAKRRADRSLSSDDSESEDEGRYYQDPFWQVIVGNDGSLDRAVGIITANPGASMNKTADYRSIEDLRASV
jgi:hypothetical protein